MKQYPTRQGIAIPLEEIWLPKTRLDTSIKENSDLHHLEYTRRIFSEYILLRVIRDLESHQSVIALDVHRYIHQKYSDTPVPTPKQAMAEIERAKAANEQLHYKQHGHYVTNPLTDEIMQRCIANYNNIKNW